jgi:nucleotide-binding universal stress UspA family protein
MAHANALGADIIVMGTHGRGLITRLLMGSVATHVINNAPCPVLTVKHPEHEPVATAALEVALQTGH